ncbi:complex I NDUFA9 subunit family protein [Geminicoccaceae bacterium 1502E]|nr:complex I NDUFA9 subunit family protein [Geminicoccaceae bacterium 1502E]
MRNKVVTIFGGSGFLGRHLVRRLAERGATVRVPTRDPEGAAFLRPMGSIGQIVLIESHGLEEAELRRHVAGADYVVNLVGILHERRRGDFERLQGELPGRIAAAAKVAGVKRMVQISAIGADPDSSAAYARTKAQGEAAVHEAFPEAVILRPSVVFGPEDGFFNRFAEMARIAPALPLIGGGRTRFQPVYVGDVAAAIVAALERPDAAGRTYELGGPGTYSFRELMEYLLGLLGRRRLLVNLPFGAARLQARFMELLPEPPLTRDQVEMLRRDNVVSGETPTLADLGVEPTPLEIVVPDYVRRYARRPWREPGR